MTVVIVMTITFFVLIKLNVRDTYLPYAILLFRHKCRSANSHEPSSGHD